MYRSHYGLQSKPFQISSDPRFLWLGEKHQEALAVLKYGILDNRGFLQLTGDVGTGKTTLINALINSLGSDTVVAHVPDPGLEEMDFFTFIAAAFHISDAFKTKGEFLVVFRSFLEKAYTQQKKVLLIIDEAQRLNRAMLEEIRLLSNIELQQSKLINIFFVGQDEFNDILARSENRALRQRMTLSYHIDPLTEEETRLFVRYRLKVAGTEKKIFSVPALNEVFAFSGGYPRLINIICDHALLTGYVKGEKTLDATIITECAEELHLPKVKNSSTGILAPDPPATGAENMPAAPAPPAAPRASVAPEKRRFPLFLIFLLTLPVLIPLLIAFMGSASWDSLHQDMDRFVFVMTGDSGRLEVARPPAPKVIESPVPPPVKALRHALPTAEAVSPPAKSLATVDGPAAKALPTAAAPPAPSSPSGQEKSDALTPPPPAAQPSHHPSSAEPVKAASAKAPVARTPAHKPVAYVPPLSIVHFDYNSNDLSSESYRTLDRIAAYLKDTPSARIAIKGYTDSYGSEGYNQSLSRFRANIVKNYLLGHGIDAGRMIVAGLGSEDPLYSNDTPSGRSANRRVEIRIRNR